MCARKVFSFFSEFFYFGIILGEHVSHKDSTAFQHAFSHLFAPNVKILHNHSISIKTKKLTDRLLCTVLGNHSSRK